MRINSLHKSTRLFLATTALSYVFVVDLGVAQETASSTDTTVGGLYEIVVTARKRQESVQTTPLSVSAFDSRSLSERNVQSSSEIASFVPNVQFDSAASESGGGATSQIAIRGIGQTDYVITIEPGVGIYLDGVYVGKSIGSLLDTVDIERIEVLRGPQGTLFGKNTIGGAIQLISKRPSEKLEINLDATTGSFDRVDVKGAISGPLTDGIRMRLSGAYQSRDGFMRRITPDGTPTGEHQGNMDRLSGRLVLEADLGEDLLATLSLDGTRIREQSPAQVLLKADPSGGFAGLYNAGVPGGACLDTEPTAITNPYCFNAQYVRPIDTRETTNTGGNQSDTDVKGASLSLEWTPGDMTLRSISAYRKVDVEISQDLYASPYYFNNIGQSVDQEQYSQEFQMLGDLMDSRLKYVFGLYYLHEKGRQEFPVNLALVQFLSGGEIKNDSYAAFGQLTYDITQDFSITGGLRYTHETRQFNPGLQHIVGYDYAGNATSPVPGFVNLIDGAFGAPGDPLFPAGWYKRKSKSATPMVSLSYKIDEDVMTYATYSQGFKGGGFTMRYFPPVVPGPGTDPDDIISYAGPEKAKSVEIGVKSQWLDNRLRLNVAGFYTDYRNIQVTYVIDPDGPGPIGTFVPVLANAGSAKIKGLEVEAAAVLSDQLVLDGSFGYTDADYKKFSADAIANFPNIFSLKMPNTSKYTFNLGGTATLFDNDAGRTYVRVDYAYRSGQFKEFANEPALYQKGFGIFNASLTYQSANEQWSATLGGTNLTNEAYIVSGVASSEYAQAVRSRPREWYFRVGFKY